jgi:adenylylsulfate kinase
MRSWLRRLRSFLRSPGHDQRLLVQAAVLLGLARLAINTVSFARLTRHFGPSGVESASEATGPELDEARRVAWAVHTAGRHTPWKSNCLPSALAAKFLLGRRGIASTLYLGAAFKARTELEAHAWLRCGPLYVTGGAGQLRFGTVAVFGSKPMPSRSAPPLGPTPQPIGRRERSSLMAHLPALLWFTGLPASGKTTIAEGVEFELNQTYRAHSYLLDGDRLRTGLNRDLGFTEEGRRENVRRAGEVAGILCDAGLIVLAAFISPYASDRQNVRALLPPGMFIEIFVDCPLAVCESRDPKGLYQRARLGLLPDFTGIDAPYETPVAPEITLHSDQESASACVHRVLAYLERREIVPAAAARPRTAHQET